MLHSITQEDKKNLALFLGRLMEAMKKYTNVDPDSKEGQIMVKTSFTGWSASDIRKKLQKMSSGSQMPMNELMTSAFSAFNSHDRTAEEE